MSDGSNPQDISDALATHGGWVAAAMAATWGWVLKTMLGRHLEALDGVEERLNRIDTRLSRIEGYVDGKDAWESNTQKNGRSHRE